MSLALLIYLASLAGGIKYILLVVVGVSAFSCLTAALFTYLDEGLSYGGREEGDSLKFLKQFRWILPLMVLAILIPSERTVYMMAAAEVSQDALATPEAAKLRRLINEKLDEALEEGNPE